MCEAEQLCIWRLTSCCNHVSQTTVLQCAFRGLRQGNTVLSTTAACVCVNGYLCIEHEQSSLQFVWVNASVIRGNNAVLFWMLCLSITSSCLCHRRRVVHGREPQPTLLTQGQTHKHGPQVALKQMLPPPHTDTPPLLLLHPNSHTNLLPMTARRKVGVWSNSYDRLYRFHSLT